jgi:hypothetical protein
MNKIILIDLDHTLTDAFWRDEMIGIAPWDVYHSEAIHDNPAHDFVEFIGPFYDKPCYSLIGITSRPEKFRDLTMKWLCKHNVFLEDLWMRPNDNYQAAGPMKIELCQNKLGDLWKDRVLCIIDDNDRVIESFRAEGITCLQVFNKIGERNEG